MFECNELIHPFQNDPGVSQQQRVMDDLLSGSPKIDGRSMADLLNYFVELSRHVNYYDAGLNVSDWKPFFQKSVPFALAAIIKFDRNSVSAKIDQHNTSFNRHPSKAGLQLLLHYIFQKLINRINTWHLQVKGTGLPAELIIEKLIRDKLQGALKTFICINNVAVKYYCVKPVDFSNLAANEVWALDMGIESTNEDCKPIGKSKRKRLIALGDQINGLLPSFLDAVRIISDTAAQSLEQSLFPLKEELQKNHTPHLALLFAFLKLFQHLQDDLNKYTRRHLDFFYKHVLKLNAIGAVPDKAHIVFEIQKQLNTYLLKKGLLVKDGKDTKKAEILFELDDEIVVNKTQVTDKRTLFLNNQNIFEHTYVEGVYMAPNADKADGLTKDFKDSDPKSFATPGAKLSKYTDPEKSLPQPYPNARIGFILASPVLLLNEGTRTIDITLACKLNEDYCNEMEEAQTGTSNNCCDERTPGASVIPKPKKKYPDFFKSSGFYDDVVTALNETWYYISEEIIVEATKKGISKDLEEKLRAFLIDSKTLCYNEEEIERYDRVLRKVQWDPFYLAVSASEKKILDELFKPRKALRIFFSGEKEWIEPVMPSAITFDPDPLSGDTFLLKLNITLTADQPAVTFYNKDTLKEDFNITLPLLKIEMDDKIKLVLNDDELEGDKGPLDNCCLLKDSPDTNKIYFCITSTFISDAGAGISTGARNYLENLLTPQNDFQKKIARIALECFLNTNDSAGNAVFNNADKNIITGLFNDPSKKYCHPVQHSVSLYHFFRNVVILNKLSNDPLALDATSIEVKVCGIKDLIVQNDENVENVNSPIRPFGSRPKVGASFYVGSRELFSKDWREVYVNVDWKDKPNDFGVHYKHYSYKNTTFEDGTKEIINSSFLTTASVLDKGKWEADGQRRLFKEIPGEQLRVKPPPPPNPIPAKPETQAAFCNPAPLPDHSDVYDYANTEFPGLSPYKRRNDLLAPLTPFNITSQYGFLRFTLEGVSFQHDIYPFVLTRQLMAYAGLLSLDVIQEMVTKANDAKKIIDAMIIEIGRINLHIGHIQTDIGQLTGHINTMTTQLGLLSADLNSASANLPGNIPLAQNFINAAKNRINNQINAALAGISGERGDFQAEVNLILPNLTNNPAGPFNPNNAGSYGLIRLGAELQSIIQFFVDNLKVDPELKDGLPSEPYTPIIKSISLDYKATAAATDIDLIHLYPYEGTYKAEQITLQPTLFPTFCDEGTLFMGLKDLQPGSNVNMLFQLAEATADSEADREDVTWYYLDNNQWKQLRNGFEVLDDATDGLTTSGIVKFALPENMTKDNSILPKDLHWIKATVPKNSTTISETTGIYTQAIRATFTNEDTNDKLRLSVPLEAGKISKLNEADANVKKLIQPFDSFGGRVPEDEGHFYVRVSELLRHKGRAIQKFDYERLVLEAFPKIFKVKCINHSFALDAHQYRNDFPVAPGYVLLAVIPDLNQLKAAQSFEPRVPVSMLDDIQEYCKKHTSPFVRFRSMNPRYEKVHFCLKIKLIAGKDENYYKEKLKQDLREFMAPWAIGEYDKLRFGQCAGRSEVIRFLETRDYVDYIIDLLMRHDENDWPDTSNEKKLAEPVCPKTPRSILIAGEIDVCIPEKDCEEWGKCFDVQGVEIDCCDNKKPIADYCIGDVIG